MGHRLSFVVAVTVLATVSFGQVVYGYKKVELNGTWPFPGERTAVVLKWNSQYGTTRSLDNTNGSADYSWMSVPGPNVKGTYDIMVADPVGYPFPAEKTRVVILINRERGSTWWLDTGSQTHYAWRALGNLNSAGAWDIRQEDIDTWPFPPNKQRIIYLVNASTGKTYSLDNTASGYGWKAMPG